MENIFTGYTNRDNFVFVKRWMRHLVPSVTIAIAFGLSASTSGCNICGNKDCDGCIFNCKNYEDYFKKIKGCLVIYDENRDKYTIYNEKLAKKEISPYETFDVIGLYLDSKYTTIRKGETKWVILEKDSETVLYLDYLED